MIFLIVIILAVAVLIGILLRHDETNIAKLLRTFSHSMEYGKNSIPLSF